MTNDVLDLQFEAIQRHCSAVFRDKLTDYGPTWLLYRLPSLIDEIWRKAKRIRTLEETDHAEIDEGRDVEYVGVINYSLMALIHLGDFAGIPKTEEALNDLTLLDEIDRAAVTAAYTKLLGEIKDLMVRKNHDYGNAWRSMELSSMTDQIIIRVYRIKSILKNEGNLLASEGIESQLSDIINYCFFALIKMESPVAHIQN